MNKHDVRHLLFLLVVIVLAGLSRSAYACNWEALQGDFRWCMEDTSRDGWADIALGSCEKNADRLKDGFWDCQSSGSQERARDNYRNCTAGQQIDAARDIGRQLNLYKPGHCGF